jgi:hypothetical protein
VATELIQRRWCDYHLREKDERVPASAWRAMFAAADSDTEPMLMDLCSDCVDQFAGPLSDLMDKLRAKRQGQRTHDAPGQKTSARFPCPVCNAEYTKGGLKHHVELEHQLTIGQAALRVGQTLEGGSIEFVCRECEAGFHRPQAYAQHRLVGHKDKAPIDLDAGRAGPAEVEQMRERLLGTVSKT